MAGPHRAAGTQPDHVFPLHLGILVFIQYTAHGACLPGERAFMVELEVAPGFVYMLKQTHIITPTAL